jgi:hypothetical protein
MFQVGDLVRIHEKYVSMGDKQQLDWIGMIVSYRGMGGFTDQYTEWLVHWSHNTGLSPEYGYYLEVICE